MKVQHLRKTPVGSVVEFVRDDGRRATGVLLTPVHTANNMSRVTVYIPKSGHHTTRLGRVKNVLSKPAIA